MIKIKHKGITVLELEDGNIIRIVLPESNTKIVKKINSALEENGINARVKKSKSHDVYRLYYGNRTFTLTEGDMVRINRPSQGELW
jgi:hypothetical protein